MKEVSEDRPDLKGIKTINEGFRKKVETSEDRPDLKGIKTVVRHHLNHKNGILKTALI